MVDSHMVTQRTHHSASVSMSRHTETSMHDRQVQPLMMQARRKEAFLQGCRVMASMLMTCTASQEAGLLQDCVQPQPCVVVREEPEDGASRPAESSNSLTTAGPFPYWHRQGTHAEQQTLLFSSMRAHMQEA